MRKRSILLGLALLLTGCTQWGTYALRTSEVWWACTDRHAQCSPEDAGLTLVQMDNTLGGARHEAEMLGVTGGRLAEAISAAEAARARVTVPVYWGPALQDYVQAAVNAERAAARARSRGIDW